MNKPQWQIDMENHYLPKDPSVSILRDMQRLLDKMREAVQATEEMSDAWDQGPFPKGTIDRYCPDLCARPFPPAYKRELCDHCLRTNALNFDPTKLACTYCDDIKESRLGDGSIMSCQFCQQTKQEGGE